MKKGMSSRPRTALYIAATILTVFAMVLLAIVFYYRPGSPPTRCAAGEIEACTRNEANVLCQGIGFNTECNWWCERQPNPCDITYCNATLLRCNPCFTSWSSTACQENFRPYCTVDNHACIEHCLLPTLCHLPACTGMALACTGADLDLTNSTERLGTWLFLQEAPNLPLAAQDQASGRYLNSDLSMGADPAFIWAIRADHALVSLEGTVVIQIAGLAS